MLAPQNGFCLRASHCRLLQTSTERLSQLIQLSERRLIPSLRHQHALWKHLRDIGRRGVGTIAAHERVLAEDCQTMYEDIHAIILNLRFHYVVKSSTERERERERDANVTKSEQQDANSLPRST